MFQILSTFSTYESTSTPVSGSGSDFPRPGQPNTVETWAERLNAQGLTPNNHCTIADCGGTGVMV